MKYEYTQTLRPRLYDLSASEQFKIIKPIMWEILKPYAAVSLIAELTSTNNVHLHGIIELKDIQDRDKFINRIRPYSRQLGKFTLNQVQYEESYIQYMNKDKKYTREILNTDPIIRDGYGIYGDFPPELRRFQEMIGHGPERARPDAK